MEAAKYAVKRITQREQRGESSQMSSEEKRIRKKGAQSIASGILAGESTKESIIRLDNEYKKPSQYTGNRKLYDDPSAKINTKKEAFQSGKPVKDPYTNKELFLTKKEAKLRYGNEWSEHLAESDHKVPIEKIHEANKDSAWVKNDDIKELANSKENMEVVSRKFNNAKRSRTNEEFVKDEKYQEKTGVKITAKGKKKAVKTGQEAKNSIAKEISQRKISNVVKEVHKAGTEGAISAGSMTAVMSTMINIVEVIKGTKKPQEALKDVAVDSVKAGATGYALTGSLSAIGHSLSGSSSEFVQALVKANAPAKVVTAVIATGDILCSFAKGEITTTECIVQLGERGTAAAVASYASVVGQIAIPIPLVGAAVGALVGTAVSGAMYSSFRNAFEEEKAAEEEYLRVKAATDAAIARMELERQEFVEVTNKLFADRAIAIQKGLQQISEAYIHNDFDNLTEGLNAILNSFGKELTQKSFEEFDELMNDDSRDFVI